jgi:hypothetical protein
VIPRQVTAPKLTATVKTAVIVSAKQCAVTKRRGEVIQYPAFESDNGLQNNFGSNSGESLHTPEYGGKAFPDAVENIAAGVGGDRLV